jgi:hypothetical protein
MAPVWLWAKRGKVRSQLLALPDTCVSVLYLAQILKLFITTHYGESHRGLPAP